MRFAVSLPLFVSFLNQPGNFELTGDLGLAEAAAGALPGINLPDVSPAAPAPAEEGAPEAPEEKPVEDELDSGSDLGPAPRARAALITATTGPP